MTKDTPSRLRRLGMFGAKIALLAVLPCLSSLPSAADDMSPPGQHPSTHDYDKDWYDSQAPDTHPNETAAWFDPSDPVPGIGFGCRGERCGPPHPPHHLPEGPVMPGILGHTTFLVDCGASHSEPRRGLFNSVNAAAHFAPPNSTILILPPGQGTTCVESVHINGPLTIATYGGSGQAVIQAPPREPCLTADIPLGDALTIEGVHFVARSHEAPCVAVEAGRVVVRNSAVDSRGSNWAFDVHESGELALDATRIETDASGVHARRAQVEIRNLDIEIDGRSNVIGRNGTAYRGFARADCTDDPRTALEPGSSVGLALECSSGTVDGGKIVGSAVGILASAGTRDLQITDVKILKPDTGILVVPGQLGAVKVERAVISRAWDGVIVAPGAESIIADSEITESMGSGVTAYGAGVQVNGNKIISAEDGVRLLAPDTYMEAIPSLQSSVGEPIDRSFLAWQTFGPDGKRLEGPWRSPTAFPHWQLLGLNRDDNMPGLLLISRDGTFVWNAFGGLRGNWRATNDPALPIELYSDVDHQTWRVHVSQSGDGIDILGPNGKSSGIPAHSGSLPIVQWLSAFYHNHIAESAPRPDYAGKFGRDFGGPTVENNLIANITHAGVLIDNRLFDDSGAPMHGRVIANTIYARPPAHCLDREHNEDPIKDHSNVCNREFFTWRFTTGPLE